MKAVLGDGRVVEVDSLIERYDGSVCWIVKPDGMLVSAVNAMLVEDVRHLPSKEEARVDT